MISKQLLIAVLAAGICLLIAVPARAAAPAAQPDPGLLADLVTANRILFDEAVVDAYGHVSVRHDKRPDRYLMSRNLAPGIVTAADILEFTLDSDPVTPTAQRLYSERFIHGEIYRTRPDVMAVVHSHSSALVILSVVQNARLRPVMHFSGFIGEAAPLFEMRDVAGDSSDLMIRDARLGAAVAKTLGPGAVVLMRGHGSAIAGRSLQEAVFRSVYSEVNARYQLEAMKLGPVTYLSPGEVRTTANSPNIERAWEFWKSQSEQRRR